MSIAQDGRIIEERAPTPIGDTAHVPSGTMVTVPVANPTGAIPTGPTGAASPVAAVNTRSKWVDPQFLLNGLLCVGGMTAAVISVLPTTDAPINWRVTGPAAFLAAYGFLTTWLRNRTNSVVR